MKDKQNPWELAAKEQAVRAAEYKDAAAKFYSAAQAAKESTEALCKEIREKYNSVLALSDQISNTAEIASEMLATSEHNRLCASSYCNIKVVEDATLLNDDVGPVFSSKHNVIMVWKHIIPNAAGSAAMLMNHSPVRVEPYVGYVSTNLGEYKLLPDSRFVVGSRLINEENLVPDGGAFNIHQYPALAAFAAFFGLLEYLDYENQPDMVVILYNARNKEMPAMKPALAQAWIVAV